MAKDTILVRISKKRHDEMQGYADKNGITLTLALDMACRRFLSSGLNMQQILAVARDSYDEAIDKLMAEPLKPVAKHTTEAEIDDLMASISTVVKPYPQRCPHTGEDLIKKPIEDMSSIFGEGEVEV